MTTARLVARLDRVLARIRVPEPELRVDLNLLSGPDADRLVALGYACVAGEASSDQKEEFDILVRACLTLTTDGKVPPPFPIPCSLQRYWRFQKFVDTGFTLPGGNYTFNSLSFSDRERLIELCQQYGSIPAADTVSIAPLAEWGHGDVVELFRLLWEATSEIERDMWVRKPINRPS
jgi:hypothetical protein